MKKLFILGFIIVLSFSSCVRLKDTVYLQGDIAKKIEDIEGQFRVEPTNYLVKTNDLLFIRVSSFDGASTSFLNMSSASDGAPNALSISLTGYKVGLDGAIDFPFLGKISVAGLSLSEIERNIELASEVYVEKSSVTVKLLNDNITMLGEVRRPGRFPLNSEQISIMEAFALSGDLSDFANRKRVRLIRNNGETPQMFIIDVTDEKIMFSPYYYLKPGDVVYVEPKRLKQINLSTPLVSVFASIASISVMIYTISKN